MLSVYLGFAILFGELALKYFVDLFCDKIARGEGGHTSLTPPKLRGRILRTVYGDFFHEQKHLVFLNSKKYEIEKKIGLRG